MRTTEMPCLVVNSPEVAGPFADFCASSQDKDTLDKKTRELMMMVLACVASSYDRIEEHIQEALEAGASMEEVGETIEALLGDMGEGELN